jgi:pimeloyl-ACP methyl ester carboxylesterase
VLLPPRLRRILRIAGISLASLFAAFCVVPYLIPLPGPAPVDAVALAPPGGRFLTVDGTRTFVVEAGPKEGPAVVLVHGFGGSTFSFRKNIAPLAAAGFFVATFDLRGFGLSDKTWEADYSHPAQADFVVATMKELGIARASFVGHSLGGNVVAHVAERHPEVVEKAVFVAPVFFAGKAPGAGRWVLRFPPARRWAQIVIRRRLAPPGSGRTLRTGFGDPSLVTQEVIEGYAAPRRMKDWELALLGMARDTSTSVLTRPLARIRFPVLFVWGDKDSWVPLARGEPLKKELPEAEWFVVPGAGHLVLEERPAELDARLIEFLRR